MPKPWREITVDPAAWDAILRDVEVHALVNPACQLGPYWQTRMSPRMIKAIRETGMMPYGFVGDGWPQRLQWGYLHDPLGLRDAYHVDDLPTRDVRDSIWQATVVIPGLPADGPVVVADIGAGYGRFAVPLVHYYGARLTYLGIDYSPIGLLVAPQFLAQATPARVLRMTPAVAMSGDPARGMCLSLPAWEVDRIVNDAGVHLFVSVHSFQEMVPAAVAYYVDWMARKAAPGARFFSVNLDEETWVPMLASGWTLCWETGDVPNKDGNFRATLWEARP